MMPDQPILPAQDIDSCFRKKPLKYVGKFAIPTSIQRDMGFESSIRCLPPDFTQARTINTEKDDFAVRIGKASSPVDPEYVTGHLAARAIQNMLFRLCRVRTAKCQMDGS